MRGELSADKETPPRKQILDPSIFVLSGYLFHTGADTLKSMSNTILVAGAVLFGALLVATCAGGAVFAFFRGSQRAAESPQAARDGFLEVLSSRMGKLEGTIIGLQTAFEESAKIAKREHASARAARSSVEKLKRTLDERARESEDEDDDLYEDDEDGGDRSGVLPLLPDVEPAGFAEESRVAGWSPLL